MRRLVMTLCLASVLGLVAATSVAAPPTPPPGGGASIGGSGSTKADVDGGEVAVTTIVQEVQPSNDTGGAANPPGGGGNSGDGATRTRPRVPGRSTILTLAAASRQRAVSAGLAPLLIRDPLWVGVMGAVMRAPQYATGELAKTPSWAGVSESCALLNMTGGAPELCRPGRPRPQTGQVEEAPPPPPDPRVVAREAVARMRLPEATAHVGPDPYANEWRMTAVGYPQWLWTDSPVGQQVSVTEQGITIELDARRTSTTFDLGDGTKKTCHAMKK